VQRDRGAGTLQQSTSHKISRGRESQPQDRRANYDVTNTVCVSTTETVRAAVQDLFQACWPGAPTDELWVAFHDFDRLFHGRLAGYRGCDTVYHDIQHSLDVTLGMARLLVGHEQSVAAAEHIGPDRAILGLITALFHDAGYIRTDSSDERENGAEHTLWHVARSSRFLRRYLPKLGLKNSVATATELVHFTGYEKRLGDIQLDDPKDRVVGELLGTADLITQMADRCYLEKCRDYLYLEFVMGGVAIFEDEAGVLRVRYQSGEDLLLQTPDFCDRIAMRRLDESFAARYHNLEILFDGRNPYIDAIARNISHLQQVISSGQWQKLRRKAPAFTVLPDAAATSNALVNAHLAKLRTMPAVLGAA
jgi:hypothetical protein